LNRDQTIGAVILIASVIGIVAYGWLLYSFSIVVLQITAFIAAAGVLGILAWIGWTMATTPPPAPIEAEAPLISASTEPPEKTPEEKS
jgi:predicted DNA-binding transcriptional regulator